MEQGLYFAFRVTVQVSHNRIRDNWNIKYQPEFISQPFSSVTVTEMPVKSSKDALLDSFRRENVPVFLSAVDK